MRKAGKRQATDKSGKLVRELANDQRCESQSTTGRMALPTGLSDRREFNNLGWKWDTTAPMRSLVFLGRVSHFTAT